jgi:hypothetical protein
VSKVYHKIPGVFRREESGKHNLIIGNWYTPELEALADTPAWYLTEKVDGTNIRIYWDGHITTIRGKTDAAQIPPRLLERIKEIFTPEKEEVLEQIFGAQPVTLYGEGFGSKIQKGGGDYFPDSNEGQNEFALFDISINDTWLERKNVTENSWTTQYRDCSG